VAQEWGGNLLITTNSLLNIEAGGRFADYLFVL
jgi:hypothetical protein